MRILGKKAIPIWLLVLALVAAGAGAAAGTVLAGKVTGEMPVAVSQALLTESPVWLSSANITSGHYTGAPQQVDKHLGWIGIPNRYIGTAADDNTAFQAAGEVSTGDWVAFDLPLKNASNRALIGEMTLNVPDGLEVEAFANNSTTNMTISDVVRIGLNTWKFKVAKGAEYTTADRLTIVISADATIVPGYYTIDGTIKQIGY